MLSALLFFLTVTIFYLTLQSGFLLAPADARITRCSKVPARFWVLTVILTVIYAIIIITAISSLALASFAESDGWTMSATDAGGKSEKIDIESFKSETLRYIVFLIFSFAFMVAGLYTSLKYSLNSLLPSGKKSMFTLTGVLATILYLPASISIYNYSVATEYGDYAASHYTLPIMKIFVIIGIILLAASFLLTLSVRNTKSISADGSVDENTPSIPNFKQYFRKFNQISIVALFICSIILIIL